MLGFTRRRHPLQPFQRYKVEGKDVTRDMSNQNGKLCIIYIFLYFSKVGN